MSIDVLAFIKDQKFLTLTAIGSIFTFSLMNSLKYDLIEPIIQVIFSEEYFGFMDITIRPGEKVPSIKKNLELRFGNFFKEMMVWLFVMAILFLLSTLHFPILKEGNTCGAAII